VSHRSELKVSDVHSPGFMSGTVTSAELKTRALTSLVGACAACTTATEIQDNKIRRLICVFICSSLFESAAFNPKRGKGRGSGVEGRRNSSCHSTLIARHSLAPDTRNLKSAPPFGSLRFSTILRASAEHFEFKSTLQRTSEFVPRPRLVVAADPSIAAAEILIHHLLLLPASFFFLFFNPDP